MEITIKFLSDDEDALYLNTYNQISIGKDVRINVLRILNIDNSVIFNILGVLFSYGFVIYQTE